MATPNRPGNPPVSGDRRTWTPMGRAVMAGVRVRDEDLESSAAVQWIVILLRVLAGVFFFRMVAEILFDVISAAETSAAGVFDNSIRFASFSVLLWGAAELTDLLLKVHHDLRATRILMARLAHRATKPGEGATPPGAGDPV